MPEMIDRHALLKKVYEHTQERERMTEGEWCRKCIYEAPKVEAEPVRRGRWSVKILDIGGDDKIRMLQCSECSRYANMKSDFCPNCGARMDLQTSTKGGLCK